MPNIAIPTSYAGSEMTNIWGITENGEKKTGRDNIVLPNLTIYDPELTFGLPARTTASSGFNAIAQAAVNIVQPAANAMVSTMALEAVGLLAASLPIVVDRPDDIDGRSTALRGACLAGAALGIGVTSLHHRLCHIIGGHFDTNHADTHAVLLPHTIGFNSPAAPAGAKALATMLKTEHACTGLYELAKEIGAPTKLRSIGLKKASLAKIANLLLESPPENPSPIDKDGIMELLNKAYKGDPPEIH
jgi:maleylacetate reductase